MTTTPQAVRNVGLVGTALALCGCLGFPALIALLSVLGATWILQPRFLLPILRSRPRWGSGASSAPSGGRGNRYRSSSDSSEAPPRS